MHTQTVERGESRKKKPCSGNCEHHIKWLIASVKELQKEREIDRRDREIDRAEMRWLRTRIERGDSE